MRNRGNFGFGKMLFVLLSGVLFIVTALGTPYFGMETEEDWSYGLYSTQKGMRTLEPMSPVQWDSYMGQWEQYLKEGEPYDLPPYTEFVTPQLYVYEGGGGAGGYNYPEDAGLVMAWGDSTMPEGEYASAWMLDYGLDPDLSNCTITITVVAPQFDLNGNQINTVSFGMQDVNGNVRSWHWSCGTAASPIPWNVPTTITINTALTGVGAAIPMATGYMNNPMFDITKVQVFIVDENASWVGGATPVPPPGTVNPKPWNYWQNLSVQPNAAGGPIVAGINVEVHQDIQRTDINDFHIEGRIESGLPVGMPGGGNWSSPPTLINHVDDIFPNFSIIITPDTTDPGENWYIIKADWWTNTPIPYCTILHLGLEFDATCHNVIIDVVGWWTSNGQRAGGAGAQNDGYVPIPGFRVEDKLPGLPGSQEGQKLRLQNGDGDGDPEPGEINTKIIELRLVGLSPLQVTEMLGDKPFEELRTGGMQENLPWIPVLQGGVPISPDNWVDFPAESFFDVYFELDVEEPFVLNAGDILVVRELVSFVNNVGETEDRWVWEIHKAHAAESDLGDAPDSTNSFGAMVMTAYPWGVQADYPSVYLAGSPPHGPLHLCRGQWPI